MTKDAKRPPLEEGLLRAMQALDSQVARRMQRSPAEREQKGVQKWEPYQDKIEEVTALVMNALGDEEITLDGLFVLSQAMTKCLYLVVEELGENGLGSLRSAYCRAALESIARDVTRAEHLLLEESPSVN